MSSRSLRPSGIAWRRLPRKASPEACRSPILQSYDQGMDLVRVRQRLEEARECGKPIDEARLEAVPWARCCIVDQARVEQALSRR